MRPQRPARPGARLLGRPVINAGVPGDTIHPNGDGYAVMAGSFRRAIRPYL